MDMNTKFDAGSAEQIQIGAALHVIKENPLRIFLAPLLGALMGFSGSFLITPRFTAEAQILTPQQQTSASAIMASLGGLAGIAAGGALANLKNPADQWVGLLKSRTISDEILKKYKFLEVYGVEYKAQARSIVENNTRITSGKDGLIDIEFDDTDPSRAANVVQSYIDELYTLSKKLAMTEAAQRRLFFERQLTEARDNLKKAQSALQSGGVDASAIKADPQTAVTEIARIRAEIAAKEVAISAMREAVTEANPALLQVLAEIRSLRAQLARTSANEISGESGRNNAAYISNYRDFKYAETLFELLAKQYEAAKADEAREGALIQVVDAPTPPEVRSSPKRLLIAGATAVAALIAYFSYLLYIFNRSQRV